LGLIPSFDAVGHEDHSPISHQNMGTTLVAATDGKEPMIAIAVVTNATGTVWRRDRLDTRVGNPAVSPTGTSTVVLPAIDVDTLSKEGRSLRINMSSSGASSGNANVFTGTWV
jgi:hypothetical protein